jgi:hypothetical protein
MMGPPDPPPMLEAPDPIHPRFPDLPLVPWLPDPPGAWPPAMDNIGPPRPGRPIRYCWTDCIVAFTAAMLVGEALELVVLVVVEEFAWLMLAWIAVATAA